MNRLWMVLTFVTAFTARSAFGGDLEAEQISQRIRAYHMPYGVVAETRFTSPTGTDIAKIADGDGAVWTGHYLMAEAYHYAVTRSPEALEYVRTALASVKALCEISGTGRLARSVFPPDAPSARPRARESTTYFRTGWPGTTV